MRTAYLVAIAYSEWPQGNKETIKGKENRARAEDSINREEETSSLQGWSQRKNLQKQLELTEMVSRYLTVPPFRGGGRAGSCWLAEDKDRAGYAISLGWDG